MQKRRGLIVGSVAFVLFIAVVWGANWLVQEYGPVSVGFGLEAPAGVYLAGLAFTLRDVLHRCLGRAAVFPAIVIGAIVSLEVGAGGTAPGGHVTIAVAGAAAFLVSEVADLFVYEPVRRRGWFPAVLLSNAVGIVVDSALFLWLAFGSLQFLAGQIVGKAWMTALAVALLAVARHAYRTRKAQAA